MSMGLFKTQLNNVFLKGTNDKRRQYEVQED